MKIPESKTGEISMVEGKVKVQEIPREVDEAVIPTVWNTELPGRWKVAQPAKIELKEHAKPVRINQYPIKSEARQGVKKLIDKCLEYGILEECGSEL